MPSSDHFRAFARRPTDLPALIHVEAYNSDLPAELVDLGLGGACVVAAEAIPRGTRVRLHIDAPALWEPLQLPGTVVWTLPNAQGRTRLGMRFEEPAENTLTVLAELIGSNDNL